MPKSVLCADALNCLREGTLENGLETEQGNGFFKATSLPGVNKNISLINNWMGTGDLGPGGIWGRV